MPKGILNKHALSFVNAPCNGTHTLDALCYHPQVTENDAPNIRVYVCVVWVGVYPSINEYVFPIDKTRPPYIKQESQIRNINVYIYVYINV